MFSLQIRILCLLASIAWAEGGCKIVILRHLEKSGGTTIRSVFKRIQEQDSRWTCGAQFCPHPEEGHRQAEKFLGDLTKLRKKLSHISPNSTQFPERYLYAEFHNTLFATANFNVAVMRELQSLRKNGCQVLMFTIIRDPVEMAVSDYYYWPKDHIRDGFKTADEFLKASPEWMIFRLYLARGPTRNILPDINVSKYLDDSFAQQNLQSYADRYLAAFDFVGISERLFDVIFYVCRFMYGITGPYDLKKADVDTCKKLSSTHVNTGHHYPKKADEELQSFIKKYEKSHFPASKAIYEKYKNSFDQFVNYDRIHLGFALNEDGVHLPSKITDIFKKEHENNRE